MKRILILVVNFYQAFVSAILKNILGINKMCRYSPTCSEYTKIAINQNSVFVGLKKSAIRILNCQPFFSF
ncbi:MAG: hypothetical protein HW400_762 [Candidatus Levybacteria bacterium]|nr:hypothetical protein [Candidatus Levybacteria bacterium]